MTEEEKKKAEEQKAEQAKLISDSINQALAGLPALIEQSVSRHVEKLVPKTGDDNKGGDKGANKGGGDNTNWQQIVAQMQAKDAERDKQLAEERAKAALAGAVAAIPFFDPQDAIRELLPSVVLKDGKHVVPGTKTVIGVPAPYDYSLDEAVRGLAGKKPHWVKSDVKGGTGAGGHSGAGSNFDFSKEPTYEELMRPENAKQLSEFQEKHPERFAQIQSDGLLGLQKAS